MFEVKEETEEEQTVTHVALLKFDLCDCEARKEYLKVLYVDDLVVALDDIKSECRKIIKYGDEQKSLEQFAERIAEIAWEVLAKIEE